MIAFAPSEMSREDWSAIARRRPRNPSANDRCLRTAVAHGVGCGGTRPFADVAVGAYFEIFASDIRG